MTMARDSLLARLFASGIHLPEFFQVRSRVVEGDAATMTGLTTGLGAAPNEPLVIVADAEGDIHGVVHALRPRTWGSFVIDPREVKRPRAHAPLRSWGRGADGTVHAEFGAVEPLPPLRDRAGDPQAAEPESSDARLVTADATVFGAGLRAELLEPGDLLMVSAASQIDSSFKSFEKVDGKGRIVQGHGGSTFHEGRLLPVDENVLRSLNAFKSSWWQATQEQKTQLTTSDLLSAATAHAYGLPMYTTRPTAYRFLKSGLKTIKYGPVRHPELLEEGATVPDQVEDPLEQRLHAALQPPQTAVTDPATAASTVRSRYAAGAEFSDADLGMIAATTGDLAEYARLVTTIVGDEGPEDLRWAAAILTHAPALASQVRASEHRDTLVFAVHAVFPCAQARATEEQQAAYEAALTALVSWDQWSDRWENLVHDLDETSDPHSAEWYLTLLQIKGVAPETVESERQAIAEGLDVMVATRYAEILAQEGLD